MSILFLYGHLLVGDQLLILFGLSVTFACLPLGVCVCVCKKEKKVNGKPNFILYPHQTLQVHEYFSVCMNKTFHL